MPPFGFGDIEPDDCLICHDDESLTMERDGKEVSLYVSGEHFAASQHKGLDCVDCHKGLDPDEEPHADPIPKVECASCHARPVREAARSRHPDAAECSTCHGNLHTRPGTVATNAVCATCHADEKAVVDASKHGHNGAAPVCLDCHGSHEFALTDSEGCLSCHGAKDFVDANVPGETLEAVLSYRESIHGAVIECSGCHGGHDMRPADDPASNVARLNVAETCAACHGDVAAHYLNSDHYQALKGGFDGAPTCTDCHGEHDIHRITDSASPMSREHEVTVCLNCHLNEPGVQERMTHSAGFIAGYENSVHGRAAASGNLDAPVCSDCHGAHDAMKAGNPASLVNKNNLAETCGTCHEDIATQFKASSHGTALASGNMDSPTCTDCHSEHSIVKADDPNSPVASANVSQAVCSPCHSSYKLSAKYGFPSDRADTFGDSFHGFAGRLGEKEVANCASCHGVHDILPSTDPASRVHKDKLTATCGTCHPGATARFAEGSVHIVRTEAGDRLLFWIGRIYLIMIVVIIGGMFVHNGMDWLRKVSDTYRVRVGLAVAPHAPSTLEPQKLYVRMTVGERWQHAFLAISFILLTITGFMLRYPDAGWVDLFRALFGEWLVPIRSWGHRIAGLAMLAVSFYHLWYIIFTKRGRQFVADIWLKPSDLAEVWQSLRYMAGFTDERPRYDRFNYIEKAEYWALVWGTLVMGVTGLILWFEDRFAKVVFDVSETVHFYEAWLAFLAIVVWHFYYVILNPDVYPLNFTFLTGKVSEKDMEHEHPRELERLRAEETERDQAPR